MQTATMTEYELERGKPMPSRNHAETQYNLLLALAPYREKYSILPELSLDLAGKPVTPDISLFAKLDIDWFHDQIRLTEAPLLAIEILSPTQGMDELTSKTDFYFDAGVRSCWLVLPAVKSIAVVVPGAQPRLFSEGDVVDPATQVQVAIGDVFP